MPNVTFHCPVCGQDIDYNLASLPDPTPIKIEFTSADPYTVIAAPGSGKRIRITSMMWSVAGGINMTVEMFSGTNSIGAICASSYSDEWSPALVLNENEAFILQADATYEVLGQVCYYSEDV